MKEHYDLFVIGTGTAGQIVSTTCSDAGWKVAIADHREYGGTCPNRGCIPKKVLVGITDAIEIASNLEGHGIKKAPTVVWEDLQRFKYEFVYNVPAGTEEKLRKAGVKMYHQSPQFVNENELIVEGKNVTADKIVIATGLQPRELKIPGREHLKTSDDFLSLEKLPSTIVFVGGGYIGMEFSHIAASSGAKVTVIDSGKQILHQFDPDLASLLQEQSIEKGIDFITETKVVEVEKLRKNYRVIGKTKHGKTVEVKAEMVFNTAGRVPAIDQLALTDGNVASEKHGITVNEFLQSTTNPNVYACGDVAASGFPPLTPLSTKEANIVAHNLLHGNSEKAEFPPVPSAVFTQPQLASTGLSEAEAKKMGKNVHVEFENMPQKYNSRRMNQNSYAYKTIVDKESGLVLGAHLLSANAAETINLFVMAMCGQLTCETIKNMMFTYPSWSSDIRSML